MFFAYKKPPTFSETERFVIMMGLFAAFWRFRVPYNGGHNALMCWTGQEERGQKAFRGKPRSSRVKIITSIIHLKSGLGGRGSKLCRNNNYCFHFGMYIYNFLFAGIKFFS